MKEYKRIVSTGNLEEYLDKGIIRLAKAEHSTFRGVTTSRYEFILPSEDQSWEQIIAATRKMCKDDPTNLSAGSLTEGYSGGKSWRNYTKKEMEQAELFHLRLNVYWDYGIEVEHLPWMYDMENECECGYRCQTGPYIVSKLGKGHLFWLMGWEIIITDSLAEVLKENNVTGYKLQGLKRRKGKQVSPFEGFKQLIPTEFVELDLEKTVPGINEFRIDTENEYWCKQCNITVGKEPYTELFVKRDSYKGQDIVYTRQRYGFVNSTPRHCLLISPKVLNLIRQHKVRTEKPEVAYLV